MERPQLHLTASGLLLAFIGLFSLGVWQLRGEIREARRTQAKLRQHTAEYASLGREWPGLSEESEQALAQDVVAAEQDTRAWRATVGYRAAPSAESPKSSVEAYFEISRGVEQLRARALAAGVTVRPGESFGFAAYRGAGPAEGAVAVVLQQFHAVQALCEILFESRPLGLLAIQRQDPAGAPGVGNPPAAFTKTRGQTDPADPTPDCFEVAGGLALRLPDHASSPASRLEFSGQTRVLRDFLNRLAGHAQPVFVRSVEVEPLDIGATGASTDSAAAGLVPLVTRNLSRFTVIVQLVDETDSPEVPAT